MTDTHPVVIDAGPLIHLDEVGCLDLLDSFDEVIIPQTVWEESIYHRPRLSVANRFSVRMRTDSYAASPTLFMLISTFGLDAGEIAALTLAESCNVSIFLTDDAAARVAGESMGLSVHGTIGIIVRAIRTGKRSKNEVLQVLRSIPEISTLHISNRLLNDVMQMVSAH